MNVKTLGAAILVSTSFALTPAYAADFGGDCCADLEERIAELEATTARKGNRKVSLTISGHVNQAVMFWDDGEETNTYIVSNETSRTRFRFRGKAKINGDWSAGFRIELGVRASRSDRVDQDTDDAGSEIDLRHASWFLKSKTYGQVTVGLTDSATQGITELTVAGNGAHKNADPEDYFSNFKLRAKNAPAGTAVSGLAWRRLVKDDFIQPGDGNRADLITYKSPTVAGFTLTASVGEDDVWDAALRYAGELGPFKIKAGFGYGENTDTAGTPISGCIFNGPSSTANCHQFGGSISAMHKPSGLYFAFGAGQFTDDETFNDGAFQAAIVNPAIDVDDEHTFYGVTVGIQQKWNSLGKTTIFGEYFEHEGGANDRAVGAGDSLVAAAGLAADSVILSSDVEVYGFGIVQKIDAAAMELYAVYRHIEGDVTLLEENTSNTGNVDLEALDVIMTGARIKF